MTENVTGLATRTGEPLQRWRRGIIDSLRRELLDANTEQT